MPEPFDKRLLAIECASEACSVALFDGGALIAGEWVMLGRGHAEALVPMIARLPEKGMARHIRVGLGPGSFTGVRIAVAAARALGLAWGAQVLGFPTLALMAAMARDDRASQDHETQNIRVVTTGGHGQWFTQSFDRSGQATSALASLTPDELAALPDPAAQDMAGQSLVVGSQAQALGELRTALGQPKGVALALWPDARRIAALDSCYFTDDLTPIYGRPPDARLPGNTVS